MEKGFFPEEKILSEITEELNVDAKYYKKTQIVPIIQTSKMPENSPDKFGYNEAKELAEFTNKYTKGNFGYFALDLVASRSQIINSYLRE